MISDEEARRRRWIREAAIVIVLGVAGIVVATLSSGYTALEEVAIGLFGIAGVAAVSFVFYEVGRSEDLDRARGGRGPYDPAPEQEPREDHPPARPPRRRRPRRGGHRPR